MNQKLNSTNAEMLTEVLIAGGQLGIKKLLFLLSQYQLSLAFLKNTDMSHVTVSISSD